MVVRIHPGQWCAPGPWCGLLLLAAFWALAPAAGRAQVPGLGGGEAPPLADSDEVLDAARSAQARFESQRLRHLPLGGGNGRSECDEVVGRLCLWYGDGDWHPEPEPEEVTDLRDRLLATLDSLQRLSPADPWIVGQRVWYRGEGGDWEAALEAARSCAAPESWWCAALEGLALHGLERWTEARAAFERALAEMDPERAREWRIPLRAVDDEARTVLDYLALLDDGTLEPVLERLWWLADPLYLVEGNDRLTAHYARWTVSTLKEAARNPHRMRWGRDFEEVTVRNGWEIAWERTPPRPLESTFFVIGHEEPGGRDYMPAGSALADPTVATPDHLTADRREPRSLYTAPYAPVLLPIDAGFAVLPRGDSLIVVATPYLPEDTTVHARLGHQEPAWPGASRPGADRIGLFALPVDGGPMRSTVREGAWEGTLALTLPVGAWLLSAESWSPELARAGRMRAGLERARAPDDVATLSDLLLLEGGGPPAARLEDVLPRVLPRAEATRGAPLSIAWEVTGLGFHDEILRYQVSVRRTDRGFFRRVGEFLGLAGDSEALRLEWDEPGPEHPGPVFRHVELGLPDLEPGRYEITLVLRMAGRSDAVSRRGFEVLEGP
ncbi:MAG TPA: hypothetical protein VFQ22_12275 [Longimicrobiales bacterium]|nr:hypothetical protein [Longimicrobiales bacterium]